MNIFSRYLMRNIFIGFAAAAGLLLPLFSTFNLINELEDVSRGGYRWSQALAVVIMTLPRTLIDLGPFIALLGGIVGLGQLAKNLELTAIRSAGVSILRIAMVALCAGVILTLTLAVLDEWVASPLQQRALELKNTAMAQADQSDSAMNTLWARKNHQYVTVKALDNHQQPVGIEIFNYAPDLSLTSYIYAASAQIGADGIWQLHDVQLKNWQQEAETTQSLKQMPWHSLFTGMSLTELTLPAQSFSLTQLHRYIGYLNQTGQPSHEYSSAQWQKLGQPVLILAMILLAIPFTFSNPRSTGVASRLAIAVIVGLITYVSYQITLNLGLLLSINVLLSTLALPVIWLLVALWLVYRFDRQH